MHGPRSTLVGRGPGSSPSAEDSGTSRDSALHYSFMSHYPSVEDVLARHLPPRAEQGSFVRRRRQGGMRLDLEAREYTLANTSKGPPAHSRCIERKRHGKVSNAFPFREGGSQLTA